MESIKRRIDRAEKQRQAFDEEFQEEMYMRQELRKLKEEDQVKLQERQKNQKITQKLQIILKE